MLLCPSCNQLWHINNPTQSSDENSTTNLYSPNHSSGQDSEFADYDMSHSEMDCQNNIEDMCHIATLAKHFVLNPFHT